MDEIDLNDILAAIKYNRPIASEKNTTYLIDIDFDTDELEDYKDLLQKLDKY